LLYSQQERLYSSKGWIESRRGWSMSERGLDSEQERLYTGRKYGRPSSISTAVEKAVECSHRETEC
jgi:hypothetical protein